ncbi:MAG: phage/plasmid primase, P4 family [Actinomycetota bacterium]|nr:phage/plasmid primase, P4 family [Actinomycetota bacterium]
MTTEYVDASMYDQDGRRVSGSGEQHSGQVRMAYRLAARFADELLHVHGIGWHYFDGKRWAEDETGHARRAVLAVLRDALAESVADKQLRSDVSRCESDAGISGVLGIASALVEFTATVRDLDADPYLLNCANGTLDLRSRDLRDHDPRDRLTKVTTGAYDPAADTSVWDAFLATVLPDEAVRDYLRRVVGLSVYGRVKEHLLPILIGTGANGKGTAYGAITNALGDYATVISPELLLVRERSGVGGPELMTLLGSRLVIASETEEGRKLDEALTKRLTGGDELTARRLYREPVTWHPSHQIVYVSNSLPNVKGNDPAVWRRLRVVPFDVVVPPQDRDPDLPERLALHADAVLSWVIAGHYDYEDHGGMREPASVLRATGDYQAESDAVARFVSEACEVGLHLHAGTRDLYSAWQRWAHGNSEPLTERTFCKELDRLGFEARKTKTGARRAGLALPADDLEDSQW